MDFTKSFIRAKNPCADGFGVFARLCMQRGKWEADHAH